MRGETSDLDGAAPPATHARAAARCRYTATSLQAAATATAATEAAAAAAVAMPSTPRSGEPSPRRLGLSSLLRQRLSPCLPAHLTTCLPFLKRHPSSSSSSSTQQQQQSVNPSSEAPQANTAIPLEERAEETPRKQEAPTCLKEGAPTSAAQVSVHPNSSPPSHVDSGSERPVNEVYCCAAAPSQSDSNGLAAACSDQQPAPTPNIEKDSLLVQQLEELQRAISCWSSKLVAAQAAAAAELQQLLRRAEAAALLQAREAKNS
ncbi:hypothetical protein Emag_007290 [Eimeria magna]